MASVSGAYTVRTWWLRLACFDLLQEGRYMLTGKYAAVVYVGTKCMVLNGQGGEEIGIAMLKAELLFKWSKWQQGTSHSRTLSVNGWTSSSTSGKVVHCCHLVA